MQAKVLVVGSLNMDLVVRAPRLPRGGETLAGQSFITVPGGKGANQAVAAARLGAGVAMIGCLGDDAYGDQLYRALQAEGIDCQGVERVAGESSGVALIVVDDSSQNAIVIVAGGNGHPSLPCWRATNTCWSRRRWWSASWKARWRRLAMCCAGPMRWARR